MARHMTDATLPRRLNLGCGFDKRDGWLNVDGWPGCEPDKVMDLEQTPWDLPTDGFDQILLKHVLEHLGRDFQAYAAILRELHRITAPGGLIEIQVPHWQHPTQYTDPTHVRAFTHGSFELLSKAKNDADRASGSSNSPIAYMIGVDFEMVDGQFVYDPAWLGKQRRGEITREQLREAGLMHWGVIRELHVKLRAVK
jgi:SAM-dependent methyltransferase